LDNAQQNPFSTCCFRGLLFFTPTIPKRRNSMATYSYEPVMAKAMTETRTHQARRGLLTFFALVIPFSALLEWQLFTRGFIWVILLMWTPAVVSIVTRLVLGEGFGDVSFRLGRGSSKATLALPFLANNK
jgi:hypothetical protein